MTLNPNRKVKPTIFNGFIIIITIIATLTLATILATTQGQTALKNTLPKPTDFTKITKPTPINTTATFLTYRAENFEIQYPAGYLIDETPNATTKLQIYAATPGKIAQVFQIIHYENTPAQDAIDTINQELKQNKDTYNAPQTTTQTNNYKKQYTLISTTTKPLDQPDVQNEPLHLNWAIYTCGDSELQETYAIQTAIPKSQTKDTTTAQYIINSFNCAQ